MIFLRFAAVFFFLSRITFAGELVIRELPVPENDPQQFARTRKPEMIDAVIEEALRSEGFGELVIDSVEWRESIPSERRKTPFHVKKHEELTIEEVGGSRNFCRFTIDSVHTTVFEFAVSGISRDPYRFRVFDEGWVLEASSIHIADSSGWGEKSDYAIVLNGEALNKKYEYDDCWGYRHVGDAPFFFFQRGGELGWSYDGSETVSDYEVIEHDRCCKDIQMNPHFFYNAVSFFALRDSRWYQVVGMIQPENK